MATVYVETPHIPVIVDRICHLEGWIASDEPYGRFEIVVNRRSVAQIHFHARGDVAAATGRKFTTGWTVNFEVAAYAGARLDLDIEFVLDGRALAQRHQHYAARPGKDSRLVYFMHIPKTAGTSTNLALKRDGVLRVLDIYRDLRDVTPMQFSQLSEHALDDVDVAYGHFKYGVHRRGGSRNFFKRNYKYISIVRDPRTHILSLYFYLRANNYLKFDRGKSFSDNIERLSANEHFDNILTRYFSGLSAAVKVTQEAFDEAVRNIETDFLYVGRVEDYSSARRGLSSCLGFAIEERRENVTGHDEEREALASGEVDAVVSRQCKFDLALYDILRRRFADGPDPRHADVSTD